MQQKVHSLIRFSIMASNLAKNKPKSFNVGLGKKVDCENKYNFKKLAIPGLFYVYFCLFHITQLYKLMKV